MKDFFSFLYGIWLDGCVGKVLAMVAAASIFAMALLMAYGTYWCVDSCWRPHQSAIGRVESKSHHASYYQTTFIMGGDTLVPVMTYIPESWHVLIRMDDGRADWCGTTESFYETAIGRRVSVEYQEGRLSGGLYITSFRSLP